jgi:hypothetical protein
MIKSAILATAASLLVSSAAIAADPAYKAEQIVQMFIKSADLGKSRAICIGTADECAAKRNAPADPVNMKINFEYNSSILTPEATKTISTWICQIAGQTPLWKHWSPWASALIVSRQRALAKQSRCQRIHSRRTIAVLRHLL